MAEISHSVNFGVANRPQSQLGLLMSRLSVFVAASLITLFTVDPYLYHDILNNFE